MGKALTILEAGEDISEGQLLEVDDNGKAYVADDANRAIRSLRSALGKVHSFRELGLITSGNRSDVVYDIRLAINLITSMKRR